MSAVIYPSPACVRYRCRPLSQCPANKTQLAYSCATHRPIVPPRALKCFSECCFVLGEISQKQTGRPSEKCSTRGLSSSTCFFSCGMLMINSNVVFLASFFV